MTDTLLASTTLDAPTHHLAFRAMSCDMGAWVVSTDQRAARARLEAVRELMNQVEAHLSRFRVDSELTGLNLRPCRQVPVSQLLWDVLAAALHAAQETGGLYDPTILTALEAAGYDRSFEQLAELPAPPAAVRRPGFGWRDVRMDPVGRAVTLPPGTRIDLGGIAKGWAADRAADLLCEVGPCLVDAGGDVAARGGHSGLDGWTIGVASPLDPDADLAVLLVRDRGVATSGVDYRRWTRGGAVQHHIIDPRTSRPAETDLLSATVVAPNAILADLHAKLALLLGREHGYRYLLRQPEVEGLLIGPAGEALATPGWGRYVLVE